MKLSVLVVIYNMRREAPRTIYSLLPGYQKNITSEDYEILVLENGSSEPLDSSYINNLPENVRYLQVPNPTPSPASALNWAVRDEAQANTLLFCIDGARILSDRLLSRGLREIKRNPEAFPYTLSWHIGPGIHIKSKENNYDQDVEDAILNNSNWRLEPDRLFEVSVLAGSSKNGPLGPIIESNAFCVSRDLFDRIGGFDERFELPGGSLCNLEMFARYVTRENALNILLQSEATFHQIHGGAATSGTVTWKETHDEYVKIFNHPYKSPTYKTLLADWPRKSSLPALANCLLLTGKK